MNIISVQAMPELLIIEPRVLGDQRGFFYESFQAARYAEGGITCAFVQDNLSRSKKHVLRGMHLQAPHAQDKLVTVLKGSVFDVAVDLRVNSPTFGSWHGVELNDQNRRQFFIPKGFAHGFLTLSDEVDFFYKCSDYYYPSEEIGFRWDDPQVNIRWPVKEVHVSTKDSLLPCLEAIEKDKLPRWISV